VEAVEKEVKALRAAAREIVAFIKSVWKEMPIKYRVFN
jgi:hypothetical protein